MNTVSYTNTINTTHTNNMDVITMARAAGFTPRYMVNLSDAQGEYRYSFIVDVDLFPYRAMEFCNQCWEKEFMQKQYDLLHKTSVWNIVHNHYQVTTKDHLTKQYLLSLDKEWTYHEWCEYVRLFAGKDRRAFHMLGDIRLPEKTYLVQIISTYGREFHLAYYLSDQDDVDTNDDTPVRPNVYIVK